MSETMAEVRKMLPHGEWLYIKGLPKGTTNEQLSAYFHEHGLRITADCISLKDFGRVMCGFVSIQPHVTRDLLAWAMEGMKPFDGRFHFSVDVARRTRDYPAWKQQSQPA